MWKNLRRIIGRIMLDIKNSDDELRMLLEDLDDDEKV